MMCIDEVGGVSYRGQVVLLMVVLENDKGNGISVAVGMQSISDGIYPQKDVGRVKK